MVVVYGFVSRQQSEKEAQTLLYRDQKGQQLLNVSVHKLSLTLLKERERERGNDENKRGKEEEKKRSRSLSSALISVNPKSEPKVQSHIGY